jgi:hypothetical protein
MQVNRRSGQTAVAQQSLHHRDLNSPPPVNGLRSYASDYVCRPCVAAPHAGRPCRKSSVPASGPWEPAGHWGPERASAWA